MADTISIDDLIPGESYTVQLEFGTERVEFKGIDGKGEERMARFGLNQDFNPASLDTTPQAELYPDHYWVAFRLNGNWLYEGCKKISVLAPQQERQRPDYEEQREIIVGEPDTHVLPPVAITVRVPGRIRGDQRQSIHLYHDEARDLRDKLTAYLEG